MLVHLSKCGGIRDIGLGLSWDTATLTAEVCRRVVVLRQMDIGRGSVVTIAHTGTAHFFADLFAVWSVGATAACLDLSLTPGEIQNIVTFAGSSALLVDGEKKIENLSVPVVALDSSREDGSATALTQPDLADPALLLFTSGTTGTPKGVVLTFGALLARVNANIAAIGTGTLARALVSLPTFFGHGLIGNSLTPLLSGGTIVLHPLGMPLINNLGAIVDTNDITFMSSVPSLWRLALTCSSRPRNGSLVRVHVGSAPLSKELWTEIADWTNAEVVNCYGITETANWIAGASSREHGVADGLVGTMWGGAAGVMDESGSIRTDGDGEIVIKSSCLMSGYFKRPDLTAAAFHDGWFRTGDQGRIDEQGLIWVTGRLKDEINRGGFKVQPAEIDALLERHPAVAEACVFGIPDPMGGEAVAAAVRLADGQSITALNLQTWCGQHLRRAAVPEHWFFVSEIPRTPRGKVSRENVRRLLTSDANAHTVKPEAKQRRASIAIAATFTSDPLFPALRFALQEAKLPYDVKAAPYQQVIQELRSPVGVLATNTGGIDVIVVRFEDFVREIDVLEEARAILGQTATELGNALVDHAQRTKLPTALLVLAPSPRLPKALLPDAEAAEMAVLSHLSHVPEITLISAEDVGLASSEVSYDKVGDEFAHMPFTEEFYASIALAVARKIQELQAAPSDSLWQGALRDGRSLLNALRDRGAARRTLPGTSAAPSTDTERTLLDLWRTILGVDEIGVDDDYFALGGTSLMAARLFAEITRSFAIKLPLTTILELPTVRALANRLQDKQSVPQELLTELRPGGPRTVYFVHDGEGETLLYLNLARRMPDDLTIVGIGPRRMMRVPLAHSRIEDMADFYIRQMRSRQPHGPYLLAGMCLGGVIAYEMASQLVRADEQVDLVVLLDAVAPRTPKKAGRTTERRLNRLKQLREDSNKSGFNPLQRAYSVSLSLSKKLANTLAWETRHRVQTWSVRARFSLLRRLLARDATWPSFVPELTAHEILNSAQGHYRPAPLSIPAIVLARATSGEGNDTPYSSIYADGSLGWDAVADNLTVIDVAGGHSSMLQEPYVESLSRALKPHVRNAAAQANNRVTEVAVS